VTASPAGHERRYRRLLWAYPGSYRRRHGTEIVTTLLEMAESGHGRPTAAQALHLLACGVRQRFRLPAGRPLPVVAALLAAIALGALGAAGGTWLGWQTATPVPSGDEMRTLSATAAGNPSEVHVFPYRTAMKGPVVASTTHGRLSDSAERVRTALTSAGWRITTFSETTGQLSVDYFADPRGAAPARLIWFGATKDGLSLKGDSVIVAAGAEDGIDPRVGQRLDVWADETAAVRPMTIAGLLLGMLAGWLLTASLARRVREVGRARRTAVAALGAASFAAAVFPAFFLYRELYQVLSYDSGAPAPYIVDGTGDQLPTGLVPACIGVALLALAVAALIAARPTANGPDPTAQEPATST
jgi:hypothetical protein